MSTNQVTTGPVPLTVGSQETFQLDPRLNGQAWSMVGATVQFILQDPTGAQTTINATVTAGGVVTAAWTVTNVPGSWTRSWKVTDASGLVQFTRPIIFAVTTTP